MNRFSELHTRLDETTKTNVKIQALVDYFRTAPEADAAWAVWFLIGNRPKRIVARAELRSWAAAEAGIPEWLFDESYLAVGDMAETIALLLPAPESSEEISLHDLIEERLLPLRGADPAERRSAIRAIWSGFDERRRFVWNKLITGNFRVGVSRSLVIRALAEATGVNAPTIAHRLMGEWNPTPESFAALVSPASVETDATRPYPFFLAHPIEGDPAILGPAGDWQAEWKWDGIRAQLVRRGGATSLWTRGEELVTERYPEIEALGPHLPDGTVIDGELLPRKGDRVLPFHDLQRRIGRKTPGRKLLAEVPVWLMAYDLLEWDGVDHRGEPLEKRRAALGALAERLPKGSRLAVSEVLEADDWPALAAARSAAVRAGVEGLMLKRKGSAYGVGRKRGDWWKWKVDPRTIDAVLIGAQPGSGKRAGLYTDYTFGLWAEGELVTVAKAYSGLTDAEIREVDAFVRANTVARFGPVRMVEPRLVFELGFEGIQESTRHRSGVAVRFPRVLRRRDDKRADEANSVADLRAMIAVGEPMPPRSGMQTFFAFADDDDGDRPEADRAGPV
ncbi:MAG: ATP-dependent DNA ligase [Isosphaeraceae bacterium]|nr:ATP-dependent DNA ligase [Isosphaeraceae bacterium]